MRKHYGNTNKQNKKDTSHRLIYSEIAWNEKALILVSELYFQLKLLRTCEEKCNLNHFACSSIHVLLSKKHNRLTFLVDNGN